MGIIIAGLKLIKPAYDFVLQMAPKIHTRALQGTMEKFVHDSFATLRPLTYEYREVCDVEHYYNGGRTYTDRLCVGEWLRVKSSYQTYGSSLDNPESVFTHIRNYGDELKPHVRKPIKEDFAKLVDLAKELQSYNEILMKLEIPETEVFEHHCPSSYISDKITVTSMVLNAIGVKTSDPWSLLLFQERAKEPHIRSLTDESKAPLFEDVISYIVDLFKRADVEVSGVREHNEKVMEEMSVIVGPWKITNQLKNNKY